jgi:hypothetical protein
VLDKKVSVKDPSGHAVELSPGQFCLVPASAEALELQAAAESRFLLIAPGEPTPNKRGR